MAFDLIVKNGLVFDGSGSPGVLRHVGIRDGRVEALSEEALDEEDAGEVIDARGRWVTPGFLDLHTHYDAELIAAPSLSESVRHGVTTITVGSCSISTILSDAEDCSDLFTRVESVPREQVLPLLREKKTWNTPAEYVDFLNGLPLGANVTAFLGHSDLRVRVLGLARAVDHEVVPTETELSQMETLLGDALDSGLLGLSTMTNPWDKLDGDRHRSAQLPSTYASWKEYRRLHDVLRSRDRILQSAPNIVTKLNTFLFLLTSAGFFFRKTLKTTLITLADAKSSPGLHRVLGFVTRFFNRVLGGELRWQTLPLPFEVYADGIDLVVFEEFGAGQAALHLANEVERNALMKDEAYRRSFRVEYEKRLTPRVWHRDFFDAHIVSCPDPEVAGKSFGEVAKARGIHPVDCFLDLVVEHGKTLRWRTVIANHRPRELARMACEESALIGFADSGAHLRNMAFYSFPLHLLRMVRDAHIQGSPIMPIEKAVHRVTGEIADWLGVEAGHIRLGARADIAVIDPTALDERLSVYHEAPIHEFGGLMRMVNRSVGAVSSVIIRGRVACRDGEPVEALGHERGFGQFLSANAPRAVSTNTVIGSSTRSLKASRAA